MPQGLPLGIPAYGNHLTRPAGPCFAPGVNAAIHSGAGQSSSQRGIIHPKVRKGRKGHIPADAARAIKI